MLDVFVECFVATAVKASRASITLDVASKVQGTAWLSLIVTSSRYFPGPPGVSAPPGFVPADGLTGLSMSMVPLGAFGVPESAADHVDAVFQVPDPSGKLFSCRVNAYVYGAFPPDPDALNVKVWSQVGVRDTEPPTASYTLISFDVASAEH